MRWRPRGRRRPASRRRREVRWRLTRRTSRSRRASRASRRGCRTSRCAGGPGEIATHCLPRRGKPAIAESSLVERQHVLKEHPIILTALVKITNKAFAPKELCIGFCYNKKSVPISLVRKCNDYNLNPR